MRPKGFRGVFRTDDAACAVYSESAGIGRVLPAAVAVPADADDIAALMRWALSTGTPLTPRGSGTSMAGGAIGNGVIVDLSRLDEIGAVSRELRTVRVGPGALRGAVNAAAVACGLRFPVDPSSGEFCTIGGMVSTNAAGPRTLGFGSTRAWVTALDCVFDDGSRAELRRGTPAPTGIPALDRFAAEARDALIAAASAVQRPGVRKNSSGYAIEAFARSGELIDLLVGSEGTLAMIVGVELSLSPLPGATSVVVASFDDLERAVEAACRSHEAGAVACELLDRSFLDVAMRAYAARGEAPPWPVGAEVILIAGVEADDRTAIGEATRRVESLFREWGSKSGDVSEDAETERQLWDLRHAASPMLAESTTLRSMQFVEDGVVAPGHLAEYVRGIRAALTARGLAGVIFGHAGDANVHVNPLVNVGSPGWMEQVSGLLADVVDLTVRLGGTLSGEHGDGRLRAPLLDRVWPPAAIEAFRLVKRVFDPAGLLNPGVKLPLAGQRALASIKYDPSLPPLPASARRVLDLVARDRAYARSRLSLLTEVG